jgi:hypothetical protein
MNDRLNAAPRILEPEVMQNSALAALAMWSFVIGFFKKKNKAVGPSIILTSPVLPLIFNQRIVKATHSKFFDGGLYRAVEEDREAFVGLQRRMDLMLRQTFEAIETACAADLIQVGEENTIVPLRLTSPTQAESDEVKQIIASATRVGHWFAEMGVQQISSLLKLRF